MCLNGDKFEHHRIGNNLEIENHSYKDPNGEVINEKEYIKDLGVYTGMQDIWIFPDIQDFFSNLINFVFNVTLKVFKIFK